MRHNNGEHNMMTVKCTTLEEFIDCVAGFVREGLTFEADVSTRTITLTGGY